MRVEAMIVPAAAGGSPMEVYGVEFAINFNDAEKASLEKAQLKPLLAKCIVKDRGPSEYNTLIAAQGALLDFMAAVAEVCDEARARKSPPGL